MLLNRSSLLAVGFVLMGAWGLACAQPAIATSTSTSTSAAMATATVQGRGQQPIGETIMDRASQTYRFERHRLDSVDGQRHYRIDLAVPLAPPPPAGYPALYMVDGNAAMATLTDDDLHNLAQHRPVLLVAVGYEVETRHDVVARAYDYTPPIIENGARVEPVVRNRRGGGADVFLDLLQGPIKSLVASRVPVDAAQSDLWGHSYGGLFTLYTLFTRPQAFDRYIVGDPSIWWADGAILTYWQKADARRIAGKDLTALVGTKPRDASRPVPNPAPALADGASQEARSVAARMTQSLRDAGMRVDYEAFPQYGHGEMFRVSLARALEVAARPAR